MLSLIAIGTPASAGSADVRGPGALNAREVLDSSAPFICSSMASARFNAAVRLISRNALSVLLSCSAAISADSVTERAVWSPPKMLSRKFDIDSILENLIQGPQPHLALTQNFWHAE